MPIQLELNSLVTESGEWFCTDTLSPNLIEPASVSDLSGKPNELSLLQYTSGSTGSPKGVMLGESSLLANCRSINLWTQPHGQFLMVNWLPPNHDMGLVGGLLLPLFNGYPSILLSPISVFQRPKLWMQAISRYRATISGGPNFIYDICTTRIRDKDLSEVDLSSWEVAFNGGEPVSHLTIKKISQRFTSYGFSPKSHAPCYGMAEATLFVSGAPIRQGATITDFDAAALENGMTAKETSSKRTATLVSSGVVVQNGFEIKIVDSKHMNEVADGLIGEIWLKGEAQSTGYWHKPEVSEAIFNCVIRDSQSDGFMRTGDLGFLKDGQLYITGRVKYLIVIRGRNFHPQDIEQSVSESHPDIKPGTTIAVPTTVDGIETLAVIQEWRSRQNSASRETVSKHILSALSNDHEIKMGSIVFVEPGSLPKTSGGKLQRIEAKKLFVTNTDTQARKKEMPA